LLLDFAILDDLPLNWHTHHPLLVLYYPSHAHLGGPDWPEDRLRSRKVPGRKGRIRFGIINSDGGFFGKRHLLGLLEYLLCWKTFLLLLGVLLVKGGQQFVDRLKPNQFAVDVFGKLANVTVAPVEVEPVVSDFCGRWLHEYLIETRRLFTHNFIINQ
jgi:hypothetical protein